MFPEIVRDEVFRIESRRLWLRWPTMADSFDATTAVAGGLQNGTMGNGYRLPSAACIARWRDAMAVGAALHLVLEEKAPGRPAIGTVHLVSARDGTANLEFHLAPDRRGEGLMTEAVQAVVQMAFVLRLACAVTATPPAAEPKGRDVLERCGFTYLGSGMRPGPTSGLSACDRFRLDRRTWASLQGWGRHSHARTSMMPDRPESLGLAICR